MKKFNNHFKINNFEFLRLACAIQVMLSHANSEYISKYFYINYFPGLPIFFFISGYLVFASYDNCKSIKFFYLNRILRIYPGLVFASTVGLVLIIIITSTYPSDQSYYLEYFKWFFYQISLGQSYNPYHIEQQINWVTWTITVEILFYLIVPIFFINKNLTNHLVFYFFCLSIIYCIFFAKLEKNYIYYLNFTPLRFGWFFMIGSLFYLNFDFFYKYKKYLIFAIIPMLLMISSGSNSILFKSQTAGSDLGFLYFFCLASICFYFVYSFNYKIFKLKFDFSYGIYLFHTLVFNYLWVLLGFSNLFLIVSFTFALSIFSWFLIEKPFLQMKINNIKKTSEISF